MNEAETLVKKITEGIQEKKGKNIVIADLTAINDTICSYFVICQGNSPSQVTAIVDSVKEYVHKEINDKPTGIDGLRNAEWVAMDYSDVLVHVFLPETALFLAALVSATKILFFADLMLANLNTSNICDIKFIFCSADPDTERSTETYSFIVK